MIEILLLDLDDTILDFHKAERIAVAKTIRDFGVEPRRRFWRCTTGSTKPIGRCWSGGS